MPLPPRVSLPLPSAPVPSYENLIFPSATQMRQQKQRDQEAQVPQVSAPEEDSTSDKSDEEQRSEEAATPEQTMPSQPQTTIHIPETSANSEIIDVLTIPGTDFDIPIPKAEIVTTAAVTAGAAAVVSVVGTLAAQSLFPHLVKILKPVMKKVVRQIAKARGKTPVESDAKLRWRRHARKRWTSDDRV